MDGCCRSGKLQMLFRDITSLRESKQSRLMLYTDISNRHSQYAAGDTPWTPPRVVLAMRHLDINDIAPPTGVGVSDQFNSN